jgi:DNA-binding NtrC family response regulator
MGQRILVVDDELDMLMLLQMIIEDNTDYAVETTNNPSEALKLLSQKCYDLVISDLKMPGMDGLELFGEMRQICPDTPVIMITAYGSAQAADEALQAGVDDFITKPFRKDRILFTIQRSLEMARLKQENLALKGKIEKDGTDKS